MLNSNPFAKLKDPSSEYVYDHAGRNMFEIWESKQFGGSVFNKIKRRDGVSMTNNLKDKVLDFKIEYLYGGGYYKIENLPDPDNNQILDIYIIMEDVKNFGDMQYLKDLFNNGSDSKAAPIDKRKQILEQEAEPSSGRRQSKQKDAKEITFEDIK